MRNFVPAAYSHCGGNGAAVRVFNGLQLPFLIWKIGRTEGILRCSLFFRSATQTRLLPHTFQCHCVAVLPVRIFKNIRRHLLLNVCLKHLNIFRCNGSLFLYTILRCASHHSFSTKIQYCFTNTSYHSSIFWLNLPTFLPYPIFWLRNRILFPKIELKKKMLPIDFTTGSKGRK